MNIPSINIAKHINFNQTLNKVAQHIPHRTIPCKNIDNLNLLERSAFWDRFPVALTAFLFIPIIDLNNKDVDEETRKVSATKTAIKCFIGGLSGIASRIAGQRLGEHWAREGKILPADKYVAELVKRSPEAKKAFIESTGKSVAFLSTILAIVCLDIPFINKGVDLAFKKFAKDGGKKK